MQRDDKVSISEMLWWGLIGTIVAGAVLLCGAAFGQTTPPNVLIVVLDDVRTDDVEQVPQVGEIAARGTSFTRAMATFALCTPSRASILSGNYPSTHLVRSNRIALFDPSSTMATWFDAAGYTGNGVGPSQMVGRSLAARAGNRSPAATTAAAASTALSATTLGTL